ncbi:hypothetical protein CNEO2_750038 [Clostridium neonatale]|uniref:Uncharacterized protein n=1 Tax=Clostridium neonatale TaxID=137838 RepID=A0AAD1YJR7_9CLOT|nr:hypothetical protein CNEO2_1290003 [Clostridium neonatale]CAI3212071.1 hypothetical protein CNEO2_730037 [Clostridium neonatale]CAI3216110.1 hypothetical protein CNEO2_950003 [Clostridium neonatale]CAI3216607.1 hypothetical protein CNEO2_1010003 [Clostridium neonatale]CAI3247993.1 hypothetical protein CNEO2_780038 [Clostridium neonatale]
MCIGFINYYNFIQYDIWQPIELVFILSLSNKAFYFALEYGVKRLKTLQK